MSWDSRLPYGRKTVRKIAVIHTWRFISKGPKSRATPDNAPDTIEGFSLWVCSNCNTKRESWA